MDEITQKWETIGFLAGLDLDVKPNIALIFEEASNIISDATVLYLVLPIIRRSLGNNKSVSDYIVENNEYRWICDKSSVYFNLVMPIIKSSAKLKKEPIDIEAESCVKVANMIRQEIENKINEK